MWLAKEAVKAIAVVKEVAKLRLVVGLNLGKEEKASRVLVACSFVSGNKSCGRSGPSASGRSSSNNCCVGSQRVAGGKGATDVVVLAIAGVVVATTAIASRSIIAKEIAISIAS